MERYCVLDEETIKNIDKFKWEGNKDFKELSLFEIYKQMLETYYSPKSTFELHRELMGKTNEEVFGEQKSFYKRFSNKDVILGKDISSSENTSNMICETVRYIDAETNQPVCEQLFFSKEARKIPIEINEDISFLYNMDNKEPDREEQVVKYIIRNQIAQIRQYDIIAKIEEINECFYLDILQVLLYSLRYYLKKDTMVYLNPFEERKKEDSDREEFERSWSQFKRKGADGIRRDKSGTRKETKDIKMLSDFSVDIPLDTKVKIVNRGSIQISNFAPDIIRFFIKREQKEGKSKYNILDLFSQKRRDRFTLSDYTKFNIKNFLDKFTEYNNDSDYIIEQFLLEQCVGLDISEYVYDFIENIIFIDKIVSCEVKNSFGESITALVRELRLCEPMFSKKLILDETESLLKQYPMSESDYQKSFIENAKLRLEQAAYIEQELIQEMNFVYRGFSKCFFYALYYSGDGNLSKIEKMLCEEIKRVKAMEEKNKEKRKTEDVEKKRQDDLFPYIQKAMMVER